MKECNNCVYIKTHINYGKMKELKTDGVIFFSYCENGNVPYKGEIEDFNQAEACKYYSEDEWVK
ncbi:hypothetical protein COE51_01280 [Bacillus pseudomycoides]|nr:hypothetical protein COE51_01280 [Bacillus pseudomycoides]